jgi:hypothetical protein
MDRSAALLVFFQHGDGAAVAESAMLSRLGCVKCLPLMASPLHVASPHEHQAADTDQPASL